MSRRILITRPRKDAGEFAQALRDIGLDPIIFPTIEILPALDTSSLDLAISRLDCYNWLILTSANAVNVFFDRMTEMGVNRLPTDLRIATVGVKTAASVENRGFYTNFVPEEYISDALIAGFGDLSGQHILLPTADIAPNTLPRILENAGAVVDVIPVYHTVPTLPDPAGLSVLRSGVDVITFTSGSSARNFVQLLQQTDIDPFNLPGHPLIACIGPKTASVCRELGLSVDIIAKEYTVDGLIEAIRNHEGRN